MSTIKTRRITRNTVRTGRAPPSAGSIPMKNEREAPCKFENVGGPDQREGCENASNACRRTHKLLTPVDWVAWFPEYDMREYKHRLLAGYRGALTNMDKDEFNEYVAKLSKEVDEQLLNCTFKGLDINAWNVRVQEAKDTGGDPRRPPRPPRPTTYSPRTSPPRRNDGWTYNTNNARAVFTNSGSENGDGNHFSGGSYTVDANGLSRIPEYNADGTPSYATVARNGIRDSKEMSESDSTAEVEEFPTLPKTDSVTKSPDLNNRRRFDYKWSEEVDSGDDLDDDIIAQEDPPPLQEKASGNLSVQSESSDNTQDRERSRSKQRTRKLESTKMVILKKDGTKKDRRVVQSVPLLPDRSRLGSDRKVRAKLTTDDAPGTLHQKDLDALNRNGEIQKSTMGGMMDVWLQSVQSREKHIAMAEKEIESRERELKQREINVKQREKEVEEQLLQLQELMNLQ